MALKRSLRSSMVGLQNFAESLTSAAQVDPDRDQARVEDGGNLADRMVGVIEEDDGGALLGRQLLQRPDQVAVEIAHLVGGLSIEADRPSPIFEHPGRDSKRCPPDPGGRRVNGRAARDRLGEGLRHGVAGQIGVLRIGPDGAPYTVTLGSIERLDPAFASNRGLHY